MENLWNYLEEKKLKLETSKLSSSVLCVICEDLLKEAVYVKCFCRCCRKCIGDYMSSGGGHLCPGCLKECTNTDLSEDFEVMVDPACNKEVSKLRLRCPHAGCSDSVELRAMMAHLSVCGYGEARSCLFSVVGCARAAMTEDEVDRHLREDQNSHDEMVMKFVRGCRESDAELRHQIQEMREQLINYQKKNDEENKLTKDDRENLRIEVEARKTEMSTKDGEMKLVNDKVAEMKAEAERIAHEMNKNDEEMKTLKATVDLVGKELAKDGENTLCGGELTREWRIHDMNIFQDKGDRYGDVFDLGEYSFGFRVEYFIRSGRYYIDANLVLYSSSDAALEWPLRRDLWMEILDPVTKSVAVKKNFGLKHSTKWKDNYEKYGSESILYDSKIIFNPCVSFCDWDRRSLILRCGMGPSHPL